jgi:(E)-4-hydroxy-3-methylbut-2-enyl-diphosphate synthase
VDLVSAVRERIAHLKAPLHIAVMGCVVNGPGEARAADIGIAAGRGKAVIFRRGEVLRTVRESEMLEELIAEVEKIADL